MNCPECNSQNPDGAKFCFACGNNISIIKKPKKPWLGAILVFIFGAFGFLYYSWKKALAILFLFYLIPAFFMPDYGVATYIITWIINILVSIYAYFDIKGIEELDERIMVGLTKSILPIIILLNFLGGIIGGVWLFILGEWEFILIGFIISIFFPWIYTLISMVITPVNLLTAYFYKKSKKMPSLISGFVGMFFGHIIIIFYVLIVLSNSTDNATLAKVSVIPFLLFGYSVATSPFSYMASKEPSDSYGSYFAVFIAQIIYILAAVFYSVGYVELTISFTLIIVFGIEFVLLKIGSKMMDYEKEVGF